MRLIKDKFEVVKITRKNGSIYYKIRQRHLYIFYSWAYEVKRSMGGDREVIDYEFMTCINAMEQKDMMMDFYMQKKGHKTKSKEVIKTCE